MLLLRQPTTLVVTLISSAREIGLANSGRPLVADPAPVSGDEDLDRCSSRLPFDEADLQHIQVEKNQTCYFSKLNELHNKIHLELGRNSFSALYFAHVAVMFALISLGNKKNLFDGISFLTFFTQTGSLISENTPRNSIAEWQNIRNNRCFSTMPTIDSSPLRLFVLFTLSIESKN